MKEIALLIVSVFSLLGFSQNAILGVVFNEQGIPLPGVQVTASPADKETYTDADGFFSFQVLAAQT
ncbi:MAG: carboxypeptidase-like regulatory domain-containing protein, partial [Flavobacteriaceae bacterium]